MQFVDSIKNITKNDARRFLYFAAVGGFGTILNTAILYLLTIRGGMNYILGAAIATEIAIISNFLGNNFITFRNNKESNYEKKKLFRKFLSFQLISLITLAGTIFFLWLFVTMFGEQLLLIWNLAAILIMFIANFALNSMFTWKKNNELIKNNEHIRGDKKNKSNSSNQNVKQRLGGILIVTFIIVLLINSATAHNIFENDSKTKMYSSVGMLTSSKVLAQYDGNGFDILHFDGGNNKDKQKNKDKQDKKNAEDEQDKEQNNKQDKDYKKGDDKAVDDRANNEDVDNKNNDESSQKSNHIEKKEKNLDESKENENENEEDASSVADDIRSKLNLIIFDNYRTLEPMMIYSSSGEFQSEEILSEDIQSSRNGDSDVNSAFQLYEEESNDSQIQLNTMQLNIVQDSNSSNYFSENSINNSNITLTNEPILNTTLNYDSTFNSTSTNESVIKSVLINDSTFNSTLTNDYVIKSTLTIEPTFESTLTNKSTFNSSLTNKSKLIIEIDEQIAPSNIMSMNLNIFSMNVMMMDENEFQEENIAVINEENSSTLFEESITQMNVEEEGSVFIMNTMETQIISMNELEYSSSNIVAISQLGYHPSSIKQVVVYTSNQTGTVNIRDANSHTILATYNLVRPTNYYGQNVNCQGNMPCLVGDFTDFVTRGSFYIEDSHSKSYTFAINENIFQDSLPIYLEFFNALLQQGSSYHADMHDNYMPAFKSMADGSFIMEADQAALPLIRLGSAYRKNPELLQYDNYDIYAENKPDIQEYILNYVEYLEGLQGVKATEISSGADSANAVRLGRGFKVNNVFVPGPTDLTTLNIYIPNGDSPIFLETAQVTSLCGADNGSDQWDSCIMYAQQIYKCQIDEPCLNLSYNDKIGIITSDVTSNGYEVSRGWGYEFGCFFDVDLNSPKYNDKVNPCHVFYPQTSRSYTSMTLLAYLQSYPALIDYSPDVATRILYKSIKTHEQIKISFAEFSAGDSDAGFYAASLFLLYDYTQDVKYLQEAHLMRDKVSKQFISDITRGNEFYWEEYVNHKAQLLSNGFEYEINGVGPEEFFRGKIYNDYKDLGPTSISNNGERVYQFEPNIQFQNSRYMLIEGIMAQKTIGLLSNPEPFMKVVAHNQLSWLTGMNAVQQGVAQNSPLKSMSFIFGIGDYPSQFHSRLLIDTKYSEISNGVVIGARGTGYEFFDPNTEKYYGLDGVTYILGYELGALGNEFNGEGALNPYVLDQTFNNGLNYIPGWINGAFDTTSDTDTIFNYRDSLQVYEFTETTSEITAVAIEYYAFLDADLNNREKLFVAPANMQDIENYVLPPPNVQENSTVNVTNTTTNTTGVNTTNTSTNITSNITTNVTSNVTANTTTNITTNVTSNVTANTTTNITTNVTANTTTNTTTNTTANTSTNTTIGNTTSNTTGNITGNITGNVTGNYSGTNVSIVSSETNLVVMYEQEGIIYYYLQEDDTGQFSVTLNSTGEVTWFVDGEIQVVTTGMISNFNWEPTIYYIPKAPDYSNIDDVTIRAETLDGSSIEWRVMVENVINPFFSSQDGGADIIGSIDTKVRVFTNNNIVDFTNLEITLQSTRGNNVYALEKVYSSDSESEWVIYIPQTDPGNNYLVEIKGSNNITGEIAIYTLEPTRWHYRETKSPTSKRNKLFSRIAKPTPSELVYVVFEKDVISENESQTIILDAKNFANEILMIKANVRSPDGVMRVINMQLTSGTNSYGTWIATFKGFVNGKYVLQSVEITDAKFEVVTNISVNESSFYYMDEDTISQSVLNIIFVVLDKNTVSEGDNITVTIDAADSLGVKSIIVLVNSTREDSFYLPLKLIEGNSNYGTWKASFQATHDDNTYFIESVNISNANASLIQDVEQRSVYVRMNKLDLSLNSITGNTVSVFSRDYMFDLVKKPIFPTVLGFTLVSIAAVGAFIITPKRKKEEGETNDANEDNDKRKIDIEEEF